MTTGMTLVLGGTGKTGRRIVDRLRSRGRLVRVGSRSAERPFDWDDDATWPAALAGIESVYVSYYPDLAVPGASDVIRSFVHRAVNGGVKRLVLLSGRGEPEARRCEDVVRESGAAWTILQSSWFSQNFSENFLVESILAGEVVLPIGDVGEPFVDVEDIADIAVAALTEDGHSGQLYELTGPRLWTFREAVAEIARATNREIRYERVPMEAYASELAAHGVEPPVVALITYLFTEVLDGRNARLADGVQRALRRPARDFADYVRSTAAAGVWNVPAESK